MTPGHGDQNSRAWQNSELLLDPKYLVVEVPLFSSFLLESCLQIPHFVCSGFQALLGIAGCGEAAATGLPD